MNDPIRNKQKFIGRLTEIILANIGNEHFRVEDLAREAGISRSENYFREYFSESYLDSVLFLANKALTFDDQLPDAYYMRAMYYGETGNIKQARRDFDKTLRLDPNHWLAYYGKGAWYPGKTSS